MGFAQKRESLFVAPFDFPLYLSGNFGELRTDHFHSGVDFKTQGVVGKHIRCVADGYICRASVTPGGYGKALYVMHDNGYMTVYAHLDRFPPIVEKRVREHQYKNETFSTNLWFPRNELRVKQGEFLAYAGNSGYSFGPHLHFEIRDAKGNELYDPMEFYKDKLI
ncbi:MAG: M23 family metallopeptidase, partial [Bacteroidaceae bacterium]|nr:M23 family metallopeptidase [Bacteroidaceae bacterium]